MILLDVESTNKFSENPDGLNRLTDISDRSWTNDLFIHSFISFIQAIYRLFKSILFKSTQQGYCVSPRSATGNCKLRTCPRSLRGGIRIHGPSDERRRFYQ